MDEKKLLDEPDEETVDRLMVYQDPIYVIGLDTILVYDEEKLSLMHPRELLKEIDKATLAIGKYIGPKRSKFGFNKWKDMWADINIEWGKWSGILNRMVVAKLKDTADRVTKETGEEKEKSKELHNLYSWLNAYWWNRTHWIDKVFKSKTGVGGLTTKKAMRQGKDTLKDLINGKADPALLHPQFIKVIEDLRLKSASKDVQEILNK